MFPILTVSYVRLAHREEREVAAELGDAWRAYAAITPRWIPRFGDSEGITRRRGHAERPV